MTEIKTLPRYLLKFFRYLREHQFLIGTKEMIDAFDALDFVDISDKEKFKLALKTVIVSRKEEEEIFEQAFYQFFKKPFRSEELLHYHFEEAKEHLLTSDKNLTSTRVNEDVQNTKDEQVSNGASENSPNLDEGFLIDTFDSETDDIEEEAKVPLWATGKSRITKRNTIKIKIDSNQRMEKTADYVINIFHMKTKRRTHYHVQGTILDMPNTLRKSFRTGGVPFELSVRAPKKKYTNFVLLCDTSRSMTKDVGSFLAFAYALTKRTSNVEVFLFSTDLVRVTNEFYDVNKRQPILQVSAEAWGKGTRIGESIGTFAEQYSSKIVNKNTVIIIISDGLDAGNTERLQGAMQEIYLRSHTIIWVNPLLDIPGYEPTAKAMDISLPYIRYFISLKDLQNLRVN